MTHLLLLIIYSLDFGHKTINNYSEILFYVKKIPVEVMGNQGAKHLWIPHQSPP